MTSVPFSGAVIILILPPRFSISYLLMLNPIPIPCVVIIPLFLSSLFLLLLAVPNNLNSFYTISLFIPIPVSLTLVIKYPHSVHGIILLLLLFNVNCFINGDPLNEGYKEEPVFIWLLFSRSSGFNI